MSFDRLAPHYRWMERILAGEKLQRCRVAWLDEVKAPRRALLVGEGHGRFLAECAWRFPETHFTYVDASRGMLEKAHRVWKKAGGRAERIEFIHGRLPEWSPAPAAYDLIVTDFFLDCFPAGPLAEVINGLASGARPEAQWLIADFRVPEKGWKRWRAQVILAQAYLFFRMVAKLPARQLTAPDESLKRAGFELRGRRISEWGLLHADMWVR